MPDYRSPPPKKDYYIEITVVSGEDLKNINWSGDGVQLCALLGFNDGRRFATKPDYFNGTNPVWNQTFRAKVPDTPSPMLTIEILNHDTSKTPEPVVGYVRIPVFDLPNPEDNSVIRTFDLYRPSGRNQGRIKLNIALRPCPHCYFPYPSDGAIETSQYRHEPLPAAVYPLSDDAGLNTPFNFNKQLNWDLLNDKFSDTKLPWRPVFHSEPSYKKFDWGPPYEKSELNKTFELFNKNLNLGLGSNFGEGSKQKPKHHSDTMRSYGDGSAVGEGSVAGGLGRFPVNEGFRYDDKVSDSAEGDLNASELDEFICYRPRGVC